jgi:DNA-directed RNA polymerase specialized sigma subunit
MYNTKLRSLYFLPALDEAQERALFEAFYQGDDEAGKKIIEHSLRYVGSVVFDRCRKHQWDDAFSAGAEALTALVNSKRYDPTQGRFITYAHYFILEAVVKVTWVKDSVYHPYGKLPRNADAEVPSPAKAAAKHLFNRLVDEPEFDFGSADHETLLAALGKLTPSEQSVIEALYVASEKLHGGKPEITEAVAITGFGRQHVHNIHVRALAKLRAALEGRPVPSYNGVQQIGENRWQATVKRTRGGKSFYVWSETFSSPGEANEARQAFLRKEAA